MTGTSPMSSADFENAMEQRILHPVSDVQLFGLFQKQYTPEEFIRILHIPMNTEQLVDKNNLGVNQFKYSANTLAGGSIACVIKDTPQTLGEGGSPMNFSGIRQYFDAHPNQRIVFKQCVIAGIGVALWAATYFAFKVPPEYAVVWTTIVQMVNDKYKVLSPFEPWILIGASKK